MKCKKCGAELNWGDRLCAVCGEPTGLPQFCEHCGARIREGQTVCPGCGAPVPWADEAEAAAEQEGSAAAAAGSVSEAGEEAGAAPETVNAGAGDQPAESPAEGGSVGGGAADEAAPAADEAAFPVDGGAEPAGQDAGSGAEPPAGAAPASAERQGAVPAGEALPACGDEDAPALDDASESRFPEPAAEPFAARADDETVVLAAAEDLAAGGSEALPAEGGDVKDELRAALEPEAPAVQEADMEEALEDIVDDGPKAAPRADAAGAAEANDEPTGVLGVTQPMGVPAGAAVPAGEPEAVPVSELPDDFDPLSAASTRAYTAAILAQREAEGEEVPAAPTVAPASGVENTQTLPPVNVVREGSAPRTSSLAERFPLRMVVPAAIAVALFAAGAVAAFSGGLGASVPQIDLGVGAVAQGSEESAAPEVRDSVDAYSWDELSQISALIAQAPSDVEGLQIAERYHLCTDAGTLDGTQAKQVTLQDGTQATAQVAGFRHDDRADGAGKAGVTFIFADAVATRTMNDTDSNEGGWEQSGLRSWMNGDLLAQLPADLQAVLVPVSKLTNNAGYAVEADAVTATADTLWAPSYCELRGTGGVSDGGGTSVYDAEGSQYQLFADLAEAGSDPGSFLSRSLAGTAEPMSWWERSPYTDNEYYFLSVNDDGSAVYYRGTHNELGVVPGFCL